MRDRYIMLEDAQGNYVGRCDIPEGTQNANDLVLRVDGKVYRYYAICGEWIFREALELESPLQPPHQDDMAALHRAWPHVYTPTGKRRRYA